MRTARAALFGVLICVGVAAQWSRTPDVFVAGGVYFLDPDCYSRMTRVALIEEGRGPFIREHDFENAPEGTIPHTTAPLDFLIFGLAAALRLAGAANPRDLAGAVVSPALGMAFLLIVAAWAWGRKFGGLALLLAATSPILAHSFSVGRPDHQSLLLALILPAILLELRLWTTGRYHPVSAAIFWAAALWVSLFEPLVLLVLVLLLRWLVMGGSVLPREAGGRLGLAAFAVVCVVAAWLDGIRVSGLPKEAAEAFPRWAATIGELQPAGLAGLFAWSGWLGPFLALPLLFSKSKALRATGLLLVGVTILAASMARWAPFFLLLLVAALPSALALLPAPRTVHALVFVSLWPVAGAWDAQLFPSRQHAVAHAQNRGEGPLLRDITAEIPERAIFLAPWWISPAVAYWSGARGVAGSSHQSLPGTLRTARFFLAPEPPAALDILRETGAEYVIVDDPYRVLPNSAAVLSRPIPPLPIGQRLWSGPPVPGFKRVAANEYFRLYRLSNLSASAGDE